MSQAEERKQAAAKALLNYSQFVMSCIGEDARPGQMRLHLMKVRTHSLLSCLLFTSHAEIMSSDILERGLNSNGVGIIIPYYET